MRVLVAGLGAMGRSHARAYRDSPDFEIAGVVTRNRDSVAPEFASLPHWTDFDDALAVTKPELVSINTYSETHADFSIRAMEAGAHVFVEKPLATTVADAERVVETATRLGKKLLVGYILRHHPLWQDLITKAREFGGPYVFRIALNQQSHGAGWETHKALMETISPLVDCGVHYLDVMCQITDAKPVEVRGIGARLTNEIAPDMNNYGQLQVLFEDGSVGWFETGWGPMISRAGETIKDVITPQGSVSIENSGTGDEIHIHHLSGKDEILPSPLQLDRDALCARQQAYMQRAISENIDLSRHMQDAVTSLRICLAADESIRIGSPVKL